MILGFHKLDPDSSDNIVSSMGSSLLFQGSVSVIPEDREFSESPFGRQENRIV